MRYFFQIRYDGSRYHGWQSQPNALTVQAVVEKILQQLLGNHNGITGSGRTDTGVHCVSQFFHFDTERELDIPWVLHRLNIMLPDDIAIYVIRKVVSQAHARYSALKRSYEYRITLVKNPFMQSYAYYFFRELDISSMNKASTLLLGRQNFRTFSKTNTDVQSFHCDLYKATWQLQGELLTFQIEANRFLRGMVRAIVGTLLDVGVGKIRVEKFQEIIDHQDRRQAGNISPKGLYLIDVNYPESIFEGLS